VAASIKAAIKSLGVQEEKKEEAAAFISSDAGPATIDATEPPVAKMVEMILKQALEDGASDIHIEPTMDSLSIRYRIDGVLFEATKPPKSVESALLSRIKVLAKMDIAETRAPQDGGFWSGWVRKQLNFVYPHVLLSMARIWFCVFSISLNYLSTFKVRAC
jgi:type II secretory ATPase GspE/PulE/Tfp pilus assembly ATPase PilB-like protein